MAVHAHPDDETTMGGGELVEAAEQGHETIIVTCTGGELGERGEPPAGSPEQLGQVRAAELSVSCSILGVSYLRLLGYRDSGMPGDVGNKHPSSFWSADEREGALRLVSIIRQLQPHVVMTYDELGFYGHPDHIQTNRVTRLAFALAGDPGIDRSLGEPWRPAKLYYGTLCHSSLRRGRDLLQRAGIGTPLDDLDSDRPEWGVPDERITLRVDHRRHAERIQRALAAHQSQAGANSFFFAMSPELYGEVVLQEEYILVESSVSVHQPERGLFDGLEELAAVARQA